MSHKFAVVLAASYLTACCSRGFNSMIYSFLLYCGPVIVALMNFRHQLLYQNNRHWLQERNHMFNNELD